MLTYNKPVVILDLDGTLYRTDSVLVKAVRQAAAESGLAPPERAVIEALIGESAESFYRQLFPGQSASKRDQLHDSVRRLELSLLDEAGQLYDGIPELLTGLREDGTALAVCSNGSQRYVQAVLDATGIGGCFAQVSTLQPERTKGQALAQLLKSAREPAAVFIGDRYDDLVAAMENRLPFIGAGYGYGSGEELSAATWLADEPGRLAGIINRWRVYARLEQLVSAARRDGRPLILGISGIDASGKTLFARSLARHLQAREREVALIHLDDFHHPLAVRRRAGDTCMGYWVNAFNLELLETHLLRPLHQQHRLEATLDLLDLDTDEFTKRRSWRITPEAVVILEGTLLLRPPLDRYLDLTVHLEIGFDEMLRRAAVRDARRFSADVESRYRRKYIPIQQRYLAECRPQLRADVVIDNRDVDRPLVSRAPAHASG